MVKNWEQALIAVVERELAQLEWLIKSERAGEEDVERGIFMPRLTVCVA